MLDSDDQIGHCCRIDSAADFAVDPGEAAGPTAGAESANAPAGNRPDPITRATACQGLRTPIIFPGMSEWPAAIFFDFDGVLVNSEPLHFYAFHKILAGEGMELGEEEYYRELIGFDDRGAIRHLFAKRNVPLEPRDLLRLMARKSEVVMELIEQRKYQALPGVEELVRGLWRHYPLAICSGALRGDRGDAGRGVAARLFRRDRSGTGRRHRQA